MGIKDMIDGEFRGIVYVVQGDKVLCEKVTGYADLPNEVPNTLETRFASASAGKVFVAVGILQLIEQGKLQFNDTLGKLLDIELNQIDRDITVRQLLTHTSGVPDYFDESIMSEYEELWTDYPNYRIRHNDDLLPLFITKPMMYPKGAKFQYNNSGYVLLATIIEKVTDMYFDQYLQAHIFDVCGMKSTGYYELDKLPSKCANNYIYCSDTNDFRTNIYSVDAKGTGAGGAFISVKDIAAFWTHLAEGKLLSKELVSDMLCKQSGDGDDAEEGYYGYGVWIIDNPKGRDIPYFQGCDPGVSFISEYNPNNGIISVLVSNYGDNVWKEMRKIRRGYWYD
ncbi:MAG: beta-lactamase family protein [Lachnospiraceae bacterium]|nr:beta-lactamase family protein [Lachnospiraceae bacterium]